MAPDPLNAVITYRHDIDHERAIIRIRPEKGLAPAFTAGQFAMIGLPRPPEMTGGDDVTPAAAAAMAHAEPTLDIPAAAPVVARPARTDRVRMIKRAYSIASAATERDYLEFFVVLVSDGRLTPLLWPLQTGARVWMEEKCKGEFTLNHIPDGKDLVMLSTGTGLAPFLSMLKTYRAAPPWRSMVIINGVRYASELGYRAELEQIAREEPWFRYIPVLSRDPEAAAQRCVGGRIQVALEPDVYQQWCNLKLDPAESHVFLCGNPEMITTTQALLEARGFKLHSRKEPGNIHFERYW